MKFRVSLTVHDPELEDLLKRLGPYRRSVFIRLALEEFAKTPKGMRIVSSLLRNSKQGNTKGELNLDDLL